MNTKLLLELEKNLSPFHCNSPAVMELYSKIVIPDRTVESNKVKKLESAKRKDAIVNIITDRASGRKLKPEHPFLWHYNPKRSLLLDRFDQDGNPKRMA